MGSIRRRQGAVIGALAAVSLTPAGARAAGPSTQITAPADAAHILDVDGAGSIAVRGTTSGIPDGGTVDILCYFGYRDGSVGFSGLVYGVPVSGGAFDTGALSVAPLSNRYQSCRLRAIPGTGSTPDLSRFAGPRVSVVHVDSGTSGEAIHGGDATAYASDDAVDSPGLAGTVRFASAGSNAISGLSPAVSPYEPSETPNASGYGWRVGAALPQADFTGAAPTVLVDGRPAYDSYATPVADYDQSGPEGTRKPAGWESPHATVALGEGGEVRVTETDRFVVCGEAATFPATDLSCAFVIDSGVHLQRTMVQGDGGRRVTVTDALTSADGAPHDVVLRYQNRITEYQAPAFRLPGGDGWGVAPDGTVLDHPPAPASIVFRDAEFPDDATDTANGALTWLTAPTRVTFADQGRRASVEYAVGVPADGTASVTQAYSVATSSARALADAAEAEDAASAPALTITSPADGARTTIPTVTVRGRASDPGGVRSVTVAGQPVALAPDGSFATPVDLVAGANAITVVATDGTGNTATSTVTVTYDPAGALAGLCRVPVVLRGTKLSTARRAITARGCRVRTVRVRSRRVRPWRVVSLAPGAGVVRDGGTRVTVRVSIGPPRRRPR